MDYTVVLICLITFLLFFHWWWTQRCNSINHFKNFKGPPPLPIVGNALDLAVLTGKICHTYFLKYLFI